MLAHTFRGGSVRNLGYEDQAKNYARPLTREENYRALENSYLAGQEKTRTADGLSYVSAVTTDDVRFVVAGLDSAWLAEGGLGDHGKLPSFRFHDLRRTFGGYAAQAGVPLAVYEARLPRSVMRFAVPERFSI
jgi:hypothetical protein